VTHRDAPPIRSPTRLVAALAVLVVAALVVACDAGGPPATPASPSEALHASIPIDTLAAPPAAGLAGLADPADASLPGALGSYTWGEEGSDAPWIVPSSGGRGGIGAELSVSFEPAVAATTWVARWAPISADAAGDVASAAEGTGRVLFTGPAAAGSWSLQLEAAFGAGRNAVWYWRIEIP